MHPDEVAFLEAIRAGDDPARLVFADWLEERGDPRGPWVRDPDIWPFMAPDATDPVPRLLTSVDYQEIPDRNKAILGRLGPAAVPALVEALRDKGLWVPRDAAKALGEIGPAAAAAVPELVKALRNCSYGSAREPFVKALGQIGPAATKAVPALRDALRDSDQWVRRCVVTALGQIGAVSEIINAFRKYDSLRNSKVDMFGGVGPAAVPGLIQALWDEHHYIVREAAYALGRIGPAAVEAVPALIDALGGEDTDAQDEVTVALVKIGPAAVPALIDVLRGGGEGVGRAADALGAIGPAAVEAVPALADALRDEDADVRSCVAYALGKIGPGAAPAASALADALRNGDRLFQHVAVMALEEIGHGAAEAVPALVVAIGDSWVQSAAEYALVKIGPAAVEAVPALVVALSDPSRVVRSGAVRALEAIGPAAIPALIDAFRKGDAGGSVRVWGDLAEDLPRSLFYSGPGAGEAVSALTALLDDPVDGLRNWAREMLERVGGRW